MAEFESASKRARDLVARAVEFTNVDIHAITGRAKSPASVLAKIRSKGYGAPGRQMTDILGVRVITYYQDGVDEIAAVIRSNFQIDDQRSVDRRRALNIAEFGYRSVHLIARQSQTKTVQSSSDALGSMWFEIQIRSLLEHAWAEVEHGIRYKAGIQFPEEVNRSFGALAGSLEIIEAQFLAMRNERFKLVRNHLAELRAGRSWHTHFDSALLLATLEHLRPQGLDKDSLQWSETQFPRRFGKVCVEALYAAKIETPKQLAKLIDTRKYRNRLHDFASLSGLDPARVSHRAAAIMALACKDLSLLYGDYPELADDPVLHSLFGARTYHRRKR